MLLVELMAIEPESDSALAEAVRKAGSQSAFGRLINKRQSTVRSWLVSNTLLPGEFCRAVEAATGVSKYRLNPDVFGAEPTGDVATQRLSSSDLEPTQ